jgi:hypothetical protein
LEIQKNYRQILSGIKEAEFQTGYVKVGGQEQAMDDSSIWLTSGLGVTNSHGLKTKRHLYRY